MERCCLQTAAASTAAPDQRAYLAADYCYKSECMFMLSAHDGSYTPHGWDAFLDNRRPHEESEARAYDARQKLEEICDVSKKEFGGLIAR